MGNRNMRRSVNNFRILQSLTPSQMTTTPSAVISTTVRGFSKYENIAHRASIQYPSAWNKREILSNVFTMVVMFLVPVTRSFSSREDSEIIRDMVNNESSTTVVVSIKRSLAVHDTSNTLQSITNDQIHLLNICFDNVKLLEKSYGRKMGEIQASGLLPNSISHIV